MHRNPVHLTIGQVIGTPVFYIQRCIDGLKTNYNHNYTFGSSVWICFRSERSEESAQLN